MTNNEIMKYLESTVRRYKDAKHHVSCIVDINILKEALNIIKKQESEINKLIQQQKAMVTSDNDIIEAYKNCQTKSGLGCHNCPFDKDEDYSCLDDLREATFNLIQHQKAEIERLSIESETLVTQLKVAYEQIHKLNMAKSEAIKEFAEKIDKILERYSHIHENAEIAMQDEIECDNETIEMQSVWDVHTLIRYEMASEPEEMNRLQDNIETIAKERLLKEIEKDFRLLIKEMTEVETNQIKEDEGK